METSNKIKRAIEMTQVVQIFEEEKQAIKETKQQSAKEVESLMLEKGYSIEEIISVVPSYSWNDVETL